MVKVSVKQRFRALTSEKKLMSTWLIDSVRNGDPVLQMSNPWQPKTMFYTVLDYCGFYYINYYYYFGLFVYLLLCLFVCFYVRNNLTSSL